jgi:hypothetical protein
MRAVPVSSTLSPSTWTVPPVRPAWPAAFRVPASRVTPLAPPLSTIMPSRSTADSARITPVWLTTVAMASPSELASMTTWPPGAARVPLLLAAAWTAAASTEKRTRPAPEVSIATRWPATSPTLPASAEMLPLLLTWGAASST